MLVIHLAMNGSNLSAWLKDVGSEDFISLVPNHWLEQAAPSSTLTSFIGVIFLIFCLINNVCTILLILSLARNPKLRTNSNKLLMSLTMADFVLLSGGHLIVIQSFAGFPILGKLGCRICGFVGTVGALAEIWSLTAIAVDRLKAIYHPLQKKKRLNKKEALVIGCSFDSFSTEWSDRSYILVLVLVAWCLPMGVLCQCYFRIFYAVRGGIFNWTELPDAAEDQRRRIERTLAKMVSCLLLLWFVSWTPYAILSLWTMFFQARGLTPTLALLPTILCKVSATLNGFTYGVRLPKFEKEIKRMLNCAVSPSHQHSRRNTTCIPKSRAQLGEGRKSLESLDNFDSECQVARNIVSSSADEVTLGKTMESRNTAYSLIGTRGSKKAASKSTQDRPLCKPLTQVYSDGKDRNYVLTWTTTIPTKGSGIAASKLNHDPAKIEVLNLTHVVQGDEMSEKGALKSRLKNCQNLKTEVESDF
ncbi:hypothetical protein TCAL_08042 [Tigriopus californicus]|uniref:G-protein coupled receptors family 1 profile domain-containing protein n=1 Tax=Tigriopus californicus TaxID=6832 RepID=A0A553NQ95_TIGCA|nr:hypothetical protein TCAL_08042 [Tigriopus californicus]